MFQMTFISAFSKKRKKISKSFVEYTIVVCKRVFICIINMLYREYVLMLVRELTQPMSSFFLIEQAVENLSS